MNARVCAFSFYKLKHLERQSWNRKILITHNHSQHCRVCFSSFVRQPFSKQLYIEDDDDDDDDHEAYDKGDDDDNTHQHLKTIATNKYTYHNDYTYDIKHSLEVNGYPL